MNYESAIQSWWIYTMIDIILVLIVVGIILLKNKFCDYISNRKARKYTDRRAKERFNEQSDGWRWVNDLHNYFQFIKRYRKETVWIINPYVPNTHAVGFELRIPVKYIIKCELEEEPRCVKVYLFTHKVVKFYEFSFEVVNWDKADYEKEDLKKAFEEPNTDWYNTYKREGNDYYE